MQDGTSINTSGEGSSPERRIVRTEMAPIPGGAAQSKVEKYKWDRLSKRGVFMEIPKDMLYVDSRYQREPRSQRVSRIAASFHWMLCGVLVVARRGGGTYFVVDGQHRALAAASRSDIDTLPCMVFDVEDLAEEARVFVDSNTLKSAVPAFTRHHANVVAQDAGALAVEKALADSGLRMVKGGGGVGMIQAIGLVTRIVGIDPQLATRVMSLVREMAGNQGAVNGYVLDALFWIAQHDASVLSDPHAARLVEIGQAVALNEIQRHQVIVGKGGASMDARPLVALLNKGRRGRKLAVG